MPGWRVTTQNQCGMVHMSRAIEFTQHQTRKQNLTCRYGYWLSTHFAWWSEQVQMQGFDACARNQGAKLSESPPCFILASQMATAHLSSLSWPQ